MLCLLEKYKMKNLIVYLSIILFIASCSSSDTVALEPINTIESQLVGKTFWRVIEGAASDPYNYAPHFYGIEFNEDGNIYSRYCSDTIFTTDEPNYNRLGIDRHLLSTYSINDSILKFEIRNIDDTISDDGVFDWSLNIIDWNTNITFSAYQSLLAYCDYINLDPNTNTGLDLKLSAGVINIDNQSLKLAWPFQLWDIFKMDQNSFKSFFNEYYFFESSWSLSPPNCSELDLFPQIEYINITSDTIYVSEGSFLDFSYEFTDDKGLNQFRISIIDDFEDARLSSAPWNYYNDYDLLGTYANGIIQLPIPFPDIELGRYRLTIIVQDSNDQESSISKIFYLSQ